MKNRQEQARAGHPFCRSRSDQSQHGCRPDSKALVATFARRVVFYTAAVCLYSLPVENIDARCTEAGVPDVCFGNGGDLKADDPSDEDSRLTGAGNNEDSAERDQEEDDEQEPSKDTKGPTTTVDKAAEERRPLVYLTREDRREAGIKHEIFPWLTVAGLLESEWSNERLKPVEDGVQTRDRELGNAVQVAAEITPTDWSKLELIYEYEDDDEHNRHILDEAVLSVEYGDVEWEAGRIYVPFGEYFSHFVEGPILEVGETRAPGMNVSYAPNEGLDLKLYAYRGKVDSDGAGGDEIDWGFAIEASPVDFGTLGLSYISDIADAQDPVIEPEELISANKVDGLSGYAVFGFGDFEVNIEFIAALDAFTDLEGDRNRPLAWNAEIAYYPSDRYELAFRMEGTDEIADAPRYRTGVSGAWWIRRQVVLRLEYLYGSFKSGLAEDDLEQELNSVRLVAAQLSVEF